MKHRDALFSADAKYFDNETDKKIVTYVVGDKDLSSDAMMRIWDEKFERKYYGAVQGLYWCAGKMGTDCHDYFGYSADPMKDSLKTMANRIILW